MKKTKKDIIKKLLKLSVNELYELLAIADEKVNTEELKTNPLKYYKKNE